MFSGDYVAAMTFQTQDNPLLPVGQALHRVGLLLQTDDVHRIKDFSVLGEDPWEKARGSNANDLYMDFVQDGRIRVQKLKVVIVVVFL